VDDEIIAVSAVEEIRSGAAIEQISAAAAEQPVVAVESLWLPLVEGPTSRIRSRPAAATFLGPLKIAPPQA
jgi:hypothetical protein